MLVKPEGLHRVNDFNAIPAYDKLTPGHGIQQAICMLHSNNRSAFGKVTPKSAVAFFFHSQCMCSVLQMLASLVVMALESMVMVTLWNMAHHYIFALWFLLLSSSIFLLFFLA